MHVIIKIVRTNSTDKNYINNNNLQQFITRLTVVDVCQLLFDCTFCCLTKTYLCTFIVRFEVNYLNK